MAHTIDGIPARTDLERGGEKFVQGYVHHLHLSISTAARPPRCRSSLDPQLHPWPSQPPLRPVCSTDSDQPHPLASAHFWRFSAAERSVKSACVSRGGACARRRQPSNVRPLSSQKPYVLKRHQDDAYSCSCASWAFVKGQPGDARSVNDTLRNLTHQTTLPPLTLLTPLSVQTPPGAALARV